MKNKLYICIVLLFSTSLAISQCFPNRHSTTWYDGWVSCEAADNPNPQHGFTHWIMYNFGQAYALGHMRIWNNNDFYHLDNGLRNVVIDFSLDGNSWQQLGQYTFEQASGDPIYQGFIGPDFAGIAAQYVLITALDNYGGDCFGLGEVKFELEEMQTTSTTNFHPDYCMSAVVYPNPFSGDPHLEIQTNCANDVTYRVVDALGNVVSEDELLKGSGNHERQLKTASLPVGIYFLQVDNGVHQQRQKLVKIE